MRLPPYPPDRGAVTPTVQPAVTPDKPMRRTVQQIGFAALLPHARWATSGAITGMKRFREMIREGGKYD